MAYIKFAPIAPMDMADHIKLLQLAKELGGLSSDEPSSEELQGSAEQDHDGYPVITISSALDAVTRYYLVPSKVQNKMGHTEYRAISRLMEKVRLLSSKGYSPGVRQRIGHSRHDGHPRFAPQILPNPGSSVGTPDIGSWGVSNRPTADKSIEFANATNRLETENDSLLIFLDNARKEADDLRAQLDELHSSILSFEARNLSEDLLKLFEDFDIKGKTFCQDRNCIFVCNRESELRRHSDQGVHCYISVALDSWASQHPPLQPLESSLESRPSPGEAASTVVLASKTGLSELESRHKDLEQSYESLQLEYSNMKSELDWLRNEKAVGGTPARNRAQPIETASGNSDSNLLHRIRQLEELVKELDGQGEVASSEEDRQDDSISKQQREQVVGKTTVSSFNTSVMNSREMNLGSLLNSNSTGEYDSQGPGRGLLSGRGAHIPDSQTGEDPDPSSIKKRRTTKDTAKFKCDQCPKQFTRSSTLREHARTHSNHRPFMCRVCGKTFVRLKDRNRHDALHTGEKKFTCTGGRPTFFESWGCGRKFAREDALVAHFRNEVGWACLRPILTDAELHDCFLQFADGQSTQGRFQCRKAIDFVGNRFGVKSDPETSGCETVFSTGDDLEFHFQTIAGRKCIATLLVELATLDARRCRQNDERADEVMMSEKPRHANKEGDSNIQWHNFLRGLGQVGFSRGYGSRLGKAHSFYVAGGWYA